MKKPQRREICNGAVKWGEHDHLRNANRDISKTIHPERSGRFSNSLRACTGLHVVSLDGSIVYTDRLGVS
jgi:hypothetical protein